MTTYWHGGAPRLAPGDLLLPPDRTGLVFTRAVQSVQQQAGVISQRTDRVYVTPDRGLARVYAGGWSEDGVRFGYGWLYEVTVDEATIESDADLLSLPGVSFQAPSATIVRVHERSVRPDQRRFAEKLTGILDDLERARRP